MVAMRPALMILRAFKGVPRNGDELHPVPGLEQERFRPRQVKEFCRGPADDLPAARAVGGIDPGLTVGNADASGRDTPPRFFSAGCNQPFLEAPQVGGAWREKNH